MKIWVHVLESLTVTFRLKNASFREFNPATPFPLSEDSTSSQSISPEQKHSPGTRDGVIG